MTPALAASMTKVSSIRSCFYKTGEGIGIVPGCPKLLDVLSEETCMYESSTFLPLKT